MTRVVAVLESMWDWRAMTSGAGYSEAPRYFRINPENYSGRRLYRLIGEGCNLLVTNACRELVRSAKEHGTPNPAWLAENLRLLDGGDDEGRTGRVQVLLVCGKVAQETYRRCGLVLPKATVLEMPHPAARLVWTKDKIEAMAARIREAVTAAAGVTA